MMFRSQLKIIEVEGIFYLSLLKIKSAIAFHISSIPITPPEFSERAIGNDSNQRHFSDYKDYFIDENGDKALRQITVSTVLTTGGNYNRKA